MHAYRPVILAFVLIIISVCCRKNKLNNNTPIDPPGGGDTLVVQPPVDTPVIKPSYIQLARSIEITDNIGGFYEALPRNYDSTVSTHPLLVFLHGGGERGNGSSDLPLVLLHAVPKMIGENTFPASFSVNDREFSFIVIAPQFREWPRPADIHALIKYAKTTYRVDTTRIYLSGLSMGGGATWEYAAEHGRELAAIVPICGASWADSAAAKRIAATDVPVWAFHNKDDSVVTVKSTTRYVNIINTQLPIAPINVTLWESGGHDAWTRATDPAYRENNLNMYEWMLQYKR